MSDIIDLLTKRLRDHQQTRPETPNDRYPAWYHDQYEQWQRENQALRLVLGERLVENILSGKTATARPLPTRDEIASQVESAMETSWDDAMEYMALPSVAADAVLALLKEQES